MATRVASEFSFVGRERELGVLEQAWRETVEGNHAHYVAIVGETGLGKRSIVARFLSQLAPGAATILRTQGRRTIAETPFAIIADLVRDFLVISDDTEPREVRRRIESALSLLYPGRESDPDARDGAVSVATLLGIKLPGIVDPELDPVERRHRIFRTIDRLGERLLRDRPLVVVIEEVHYADPQSLELLRGLVMARRSLPLLGIATARDDERIRAALADITPEFRRVIELGELDSREREQLLMGRFADDPAARPLCEQLLLRGGGNPFYLRELVESLLERGVVAAEQGKLVWVKRDAELQVPTTVEAVIASRLDALPAGQKETLLRAAVLGRRIVPAELSALLGRDVSAELEELTLRGLLDRDKAGYAFHNQIIMEIAYAAIPEEEKRELHRRATRVLAHRENARPEADAVLARHAAAAGDRDEAVRRFLQAARAARDVAGNKLAFDHLTRARKLLAQDDHVRRFEIASEREHILRGWGHRAAALRELAVMQRAAEAMGDRARQAQALARLARFNQEVGRSARARREAARALTLARQAADQKTEIEALRIEALVLHGLGLTPDALLRIHEALALCSPEGPAPGAAGEPPRPIDRDTLLARASVMSSRGTILLATGQFRDAVNAYAEAMVIYRRLAVRRMEAAALNDLGIVSVGLGEYEEALAYYKRSLAIDREIGNRAALGSKLSNIGQACLDLGDFERAERYLRKAIEIHEALGERSQAADAFITLGQLFLRRDRPQVARQEIDKGLAVALETSNRFQEIRALIYLAMAHLAGREAPDGALELARSATRLAQAAHIPQGHAWGLAVEALALAASGRAAEGTARSAEAVRLLDSGPHFQDREEILHCHARVLVEAGRAAEAALVAQRAWDEVQAKARRVRNRGLRERYLLAPPACDIVRTWHELRVDPAAGGGT
jgi:predicted ATPase